MGNAGFAHTALPITQPKMADAIFGFGLTLAPKRSLGFDRKNTVFLIVQWEGSHFVQRAVSQDCGCASR
jgi:hypothetical protein